MDKNFYLGHTPTVFISSTCFDLSQIRTNIKLFIEQQLGYEALLSEYNSFPINPSLDTVNNCLRVVQERADILVLVVGGKYGHITETGHSVTNLEYLEAQAKAIPIYVFVDKTIIGMLPIWKDNPNADFSSIVDTPELFNFVNSLRNKDNIWMYGFESAQDIEGALRTQLGYLFYDCLKLRSQIENTNLPQSAYQLKGAAFKIILEKPDGWEYKLFGQLFEDGINKLTSLRRDLKYRISYGSSKNLTEPQAIIEWVQQKISELQRAVDRLNTLINKALPEAFGAPGVSGDIDYIIYAAETMVNTYKSMIQWVLNLSLVVVPDDWDSLIKELEVFGLSPIEDIELYLKKYLEAMSMIPSKITEDQNIHLDLTLTLQGPDSTKFEKEMKRICSIYGN